MNKNVLLILAAVAVVLSTLMVNCSERIVSHDNHKVYASFKVGAGEAVATLQEFLLTVTAEDFTEPLTATLQLIGDSLVGEITVPAGLRRTFRIDAFDTLGNTIYSGSTTMDLVHGEPIEIDIDIQPVVPVLVLSPRYMDVTMSDTFHLDVSVHNAPGLAYVEFDLDFNSASGTILSPVIAPDTSLDSTIGVSHGTGDTYSTIWVSVTSGTQGMIVDSNGDADLATLTFDTHSDTNMDLDSAYISITPVYAYDTLENTFDNMFGDRAQIILHRLPPAK